MLFFTILPDNTFSKPKRLQTMNVKKVKVTPEVPIFDPINLTSADISTKLHCFMKTSKAYQQLFKLKRSKTKKMLLLQQ